MDFVPQTFILTSTKPPRYVITIITTLGCPINPVIGFEYGRKCLRKLVQVRNAVRLTQRVFIKTLIRFSHWKSYFLFESKEKSKHCLPEQY